MNKEQKAFMAYLTLQGEEEITEVSDKKKAVIMRKLIDSIAENLDMSKGEAAQLLKKTTKRKLPFHLLKDYN